MLTIDPSVEAAWPDLVAGVREFAAPILARKPQVEFVLMFLDGKLGLLALCSEVTPGRWWRAIPEPTQAINWADLPFTPVLDDVLFHRLAERLLYGT